MTDAQQKAFKEWIRTQHAGPRMFHSSTGETLLGISESAFLAGMTAGRAEAVAEIAAMLREWQDFAMEYRPVELDDESLEQIAFHIENREKKP
jgi:3-methyladenine DNA glycosylase/8-oxoguanine DNA glycosylase